jgi:hypothetical protein
MDAKRVQTERMVTLTPISLNPLASFALPAFRRFNQPYQFTAWCAWPLPGGHFIAVTDGKWAGKRRMLVPIAVVQHEGPSTRSEGRLPTYSVEKLISRAQTILQVNHSVAENQEQTRAPAYIERLSAEIVGGRWSFASFKFRPF